MYKVCHPMHVPASTVYTHKIQPLPTSIQDAEQILPQSQFMITDSLDDRAHVMDLMPHTSIAGHMLTQKIMKIMKESTSIEDKKITKMWRCITTAHNAPSAILGALRNKTANAVKTPFMDHCETSTEKIIILQQE